MRLSVFTTETRPRQRGDNYLDARKCYTALADELIIIDGHTTWPREFNWPIIGEHFQQGYERATGDWVIHADLDFLFHEKDFDNIREALNKHRTAPAISFYKWQFILPDRYNLKSRLVLAVNKAYFGSRIKFNGGGDLCQPTLDGEDIIIDDIPQAGVPFYNYEHILKTKIQIKDDVSRMDRAYKRHFGIPLYSNDNKAAYDGWYEMISGRFKKPSRKIQLNEHPKFIQETIKNLKPENFGYNGFGLIDGKVYD